MSYEAGDDGKTWSVKVRPFLVCPMKYDNIHPVTDAELVRVFGPSKDGFPLFRVVRLLPHDAPDHGENFDFDPRPPLSRMDRFWLWLWGRLGR